MRNIFCGFVLALLTMSAGPALAVPSYAEQTGQPCESCHVGGFGPQLTPFGRSFKMEGYTMRVGDSFSLPVSAMVVASYVHTSADQPPPPHYAPNDNLTLDQASLFIAGGIDDHFGGFTQWTYDGVGRAYSWDNIDLRAIDHETIADSDVLLGLSLNNNPTVNDDWNTLPGWGFPYTDSDLIPGPGAGTVLDGGLAQSVLGLNAYAYWDSSIYTEAGLYWTPGRDFLRAMGTDPDEGGGVVDGAAPYFRVAYQKDYGDQNFEVGAFAMFPHLFPGGDKSTGTSDRYSDVGLDASYQFIGDSTEIYSLNARYTYETQNLAASYLLDDVDHPHNHLSDFRLDGSYYWHNEFGGSVGLFDTTGSADAGLYGDNRTLTPDSNGFLFQIDATPFANDPSPLGPRFAMRVGLQYFVYTRFNGATTNYDGLGHNASDNNTLRIFTWFAL